MLDRPTNRPKMEAAQRRARIWLDLYEYRAQNSHISVCMRGNMPSNDLVMLSAKEYVTMHLLVGSPKRMYGLELVEQSEGELRRGTVYVVLNRLEERGFVTSKKEEAAPGIAQPRRHYRPTAEGVRVFRANEAARMKLREALA